MPLGSFKLRIAALAIDLVIVYHVFIGLLSRIFISSSFFNYSKRDLFVALLLALIFPVYKIIAEWKFGYTLGKKMVGLKVVDTAFHPIKLNAALIRNVYLILYFVIPGIFLLVSHKLFFNHHSGGDYIDIVFTGIELLFKGLIVLVVYLIYNLVWGLLIFLTSISAADSAKKQTLFDQISKTLCVTSAKRT